MFRSLLLNFTFLGLCFLSLAPTVKQDSIGETPNQRAQYNQLYPYSVEVCAVSQLKPVGGKEGGIHGHAVMYMNGACRDPEASYPTLKMCDASVDLTDPDAGVGISVDKMFRTVNWVAVPGREFFIHGDLRAEDVLDDAHREQVIQKAVKLGLFRGIEFQEKYLASKPANQSMEEHVARLSLSTDYALKFGRSVFCATMPVAPEMMERAVKYLNDLNTEYATGQADYNWSGYYDNCAHTIRNALAAAGLWEPKSVNAMRWRQLFHVAVPANEFANLARLPGKVDLDKYKKIYRDDDLHDRFLEDDWLPMRHGALVQTIPVHQANDLYNRELSIYVLESPFLKNRSRQVRKMFAQPHRTDLVTNLQDYEQLYETILEERPKHSLKTPKPGSRRDFRAKYFDYIARQLQDVTEKLDQLTLGEGE